MTGKLQRSTPSQDAPEPYNTSAGLASLTKKRAVFLAALRSGQYAKGTIRSDEEGKPIIESPEDNAGCCACGLMVMLFPKPDGTPNFLYAKRSLGVSSADCRYIQAELNDTPLTFSEIADRIEAEVFAKRRQNKDYAA